MRRVESFGDRSRSQGSVERLLHDSSRRLWRCCRNLSVIGFKILLDLFASSPQPLCFRELPYQCRTRQAGESKLDSRAKWDYGILLVDKFIGRSIGVVVHLATVTLPFKFFKFSFLPSQTLGTLVAMTTNFAFDNILTYRDVRLKGLK
jgi:dolichol-phosphate mannosyltransferase